MAQRQPDGQTLRVHLQAMADRGHVDPRLEPEPIPTVVESLWNAFLLLSASRRSGFGFHAITLIDLDAFCRLYDVSLSPWELETLIAMDAAALSVAASSTKP